MRKGVQKRDSGHDQPSRFDLLLLEMQASVSG